MIPEHASPDERDAKGMLQREYARRFARHAQYRDDVWKELIADFFQPLIARNSTLLDLGCGWGEFVNNIMAARKYGMDLATTCGPGTSGPPAPSHSCGSISNCRSCRR